MTPAKGHNCHLLIHACYRWSLGTLTVGDSQKAAKSKPVHDAGFKSQLCYCCLTRSCLSHLGYRNRLHEFPSAVSAAEWSRLSEIQVKEVSALQFDSKWSSSGDTDLPLSLGTLFLMPEWTTLEIYCRHKRALSGNTLFVPTLLPQILPQENPSLPSQITKAVDHRNLPFTLKKPNIVK